MANEENLKNGEKTRFRGELAVEAQKKSAQARRRNNSLRQLAKQMMQTPIDAPEDQLESLRRLGFDTDKPELQMVLLGKLAAIALCDDPALVMKAMAMLMEITGDDGYSVNKEADRKIKRAELKLKQEAAARENWE